MIHPPTLPATRRVFDPFRNRPKPAWTCGTCPTCGDALVSNSYYTGGIGYRVFYECWGSLNATPTCHYRKVL